LGFRSCFGWGFLFRGIGHHQFVFGKLSKLKIFCAFKRLLGAYQCALGAKDAFFVMDDAFELFIGYFVYGYSGRWAVSHAELAADASFSEELYPRAELVAFNGFNERIVLRCRFSQYVVQYFSQHRSGMNHIILVIL
jgi:hypothetical protein